MIAPETLIGAGAIVMKDTVEKGVYLPSLCARRRRHVENVVCLLYGKGNKRWAAATDYYHIKYAESSDGIHWHRDCRVCIDYKSEYEYAIARPCIIKEAGVYKFGIPTGGTVIGSGMPSLRMVCTGCGGMNRAE